MTTNRTKTKTAKTTAARSAQWFIREINRRVKTDPTKAIRLDVTNEERGAALHAWSCLTEDRAPRDDLPNVFTNGQRPQAVPVKLATRGWKFWRADALTPGGHAELERWTFFPPDYAWPGPVERVLVATIRDTIEQRLDTGKLGREICTTLQTEYGPEYHVEMPGSTADDDPALPKGLYCHVWRGEDWLLVSRAEFYPAELPATIVTIDKARRRLETILAAVEDRGSIFARLGDLWLVAYGGRRAPLLPDRKGMKYLSAILKAGDEGLTPRELCGMVNLLPPGDAPEGEKGENSPTPGTDADGREIDRADAQDARGWRRNGESRGFRITQEQYAAAVAKLKEELRDAQRDGDHEQARVVRKTLRELGEGDPTAPTGTRLLPDLKAEQMRDSVRRAIERTIQDVIRPHHPAAAAYLGLHVNTDCGRWRYTGQPFTT